MNHAGALLQARRRESTDSYLTDSTLGTDIVNTCGVLLGTWPKQRLPNINVIENEQQKKKNNKIAWHLPFQ